MMCPRFVYHNYVGYGKLFVYVKSYHEWFVTSDTYSGGEVAILDH